MTSDKRVILNFHGIGEPHGEIGEDEKPYWVSEAFFAEVVGMAAGRTDRSRIFWTFDDGNGSDLAIAAPLLSQAAFTGDFFLLTGRLDASHYLSAADARSLLAMGMRIGLHGRDHVDWRALDELALDRETVEARTVLAAVADTAIDAVSIPFGAYNQRVIRRLRQLGYAHIYTTDGGTTTSRDIIRNRTSIRSDMTLEDVAAILDDRTTLGRRARRLLSTTLRRSIL